MKNLNIISTCLLCLLLGTSVEKACAVMDQPIAIDSRIKTFIYSENEVFRLVVHYGYQTSIEFAEDEEIQTISAGNNYAWQLTPVGKRLFIKPLEENILTNMTIITNKRVYHLEIQSKLLSYTVDEELVYVVRFFYPEENFDLNRPQIIAETEENIPDIRPFNFNYTLTGAEALAPVKIFDDGINTFFRFKAGFNEVPAFSIIKGNGSKEYLKARLKGDYFVINRISEYLEISTGDKVVVIYNENRISDKRGF